MAEREFDIIIYGANGFTAQFITQELAKCGHKIALAARSVHKIPTTALPTIECTISDIAALTARTRVLVNCAGPYAYTGSAVVVACVATATNYIDFSGETRFLRETLAYNNEAAKNAGIAVVQACGFDSVPADIGALHLAQHFDSVAIDSTLHVWNCRLNTGTWASLLNSFRGTGLLRARERSSAAQPERTGLWRYSDSHKSYDILFRSSDPYVAKRSGEYFSSLGLKSYSYTAYINIGSCLSLLLCLFFGTLTYLMAQIPLCHSLMLAFPKAFSLGIVESRGPSAGSISRSHFMMELIGRGLSDGSPRKKTLRIVGPDPGYLTTSVCVSQCALLLLEREADIPRGVLTPAQAFHKTDIVDRLAAQGISFQFVE